jgi:hypothetical protein
MAVKKTLRGPNGVKLILDSSQYFPNDPGNGTPALVEYKGGISTFECARNEGEVDAGEMIQLPQSVLDWLWSDEVDKQVDAVYA